MALATNAALQADGDLLDEDERTRIDRLLLALADTARGDDADATDAATKALAEGTENFAALRMNRGIQQALTGRRLDDV
jgi:molecular chaperone HscA